MIALELPKYTTACVNSIHLQPSDVGVLDEFATARIPFVLVRRDRDGYDVSTDLDDDADGSKDAALAERMSPEFMRLYHEAIEAGHAFLRFDVDGPVIDA